MPTINLSKLTYQKLQNLMAQELKKKISIDPKALLKIARNKYGMSFDMMVQKLLKNYQVK